MHLVLKAYLNHRIDCWRVWLACSSHWPQGVQTSTAKQRDREAEFKHGGGLRHSLFQQALADSQQHLDFMKPFLPNYNMQHQLCSLHLRTCHFGHIQPNNIFLLVKKNQFTGTDDASLFLKCRECMVQGRDFLVW